MIWTRPIDSPESKPLAGTDFATTMFWSPDSRFLAFVAQDRLQKLEVSSGSVSTISDASSNSQGAWNLEGTILVATTPWGPLHRIPATGGVATAVTTIEQSRGDLGHGWPRWLPDNRGFLYFVRTTNPSTTGTYWKALGSAEAQSRLIVASHAAGTYAPSHTGRGGHLLFLRGDTLLAQSLDTSDLEFTGEPVAIARGVSGTMPDYPGNPGFSISEHGVLAYHSITGARSHFAWLDRTGKRVAVIAPSDVHSHPRLSADAKRLAFDRPDSKTGQNELWITDISRGATSRLTSHPRCPALETIPTESLR